MFATHGIPLEVYADNMPFGSKECFDFSKKWSFKFVTSSPRYPQSNGLAERAVQTAKNILRKTESLQLSLLEYRNTPITGTDKSPAQMLMSRMLRSKLPAMTKSFATVTNDYENEKKS